MGLQPPIPIVLAPMAGGPTTPELVAAVTEADACGFLAGGYLPVERLADQIAAVRGLTRRKFGVNVFCPPPGPTPPARYAAYVERLDRWAGARGLPVGDPAFGDDDYPAKIDLLVSRPVSAVSFTFGAPSREVAGRLHAVGSEVWVTVTTPAEAALAVEAGADALVVQGDEAGGHRGSFDDDGSEGSYSLLALLQLLNDVKRPLIAAGGLTTGRGIAAALVAGASAVQLGTAFLLCPEAGTDDAYRAALRRRTAPTRPTRAFTGRTARGILNEFMVEHEAEAVSAYPEINSATRPLRAAAREAGDASMFNLWAGETYPLIREAPAAEVVRDLWRAADEALPRR